MIKGGLMDLRSTHPCGLIWLASGLIAWRCPSILCSYFFAKMGWCMVLTGSLLDHWLSLTRSHSAALTIFPMFLLLFIYRQTSMSEEHSGLAASEQVRGQALRMSSRKLKLYRSLRWRARDGESPAVDKPAEWVDHSAQDTESTQKVGWLRGLTAGCLWVDCFSHTHLSTPLVAWRRCNQPISNQSTPLTNICGVDRVTRMKNKA